MFTSQYHEADIHQLEVKGEIPSWLSGSYISTGPAQFEVGKRQFSHWFDGFAMLKKFQFHNGTVHFQNRFLGSKQYCKSKAAHRLYYNEFATRAETSLLGQLAYNVRALTQGDVYDNCNVNVSQIDGHFIALTESPFIIEFSPQTLETTGPFKFEDNLAYHVGLAHPHLDPETGEIISVAIELGPKNKYHIYRIPAQSKKRELMTTYISESLFYMHSFSITPNYVILFKTPLVLNKYKLMLRQPFMDALSWQEKLASAFVIIDRRNGEIKEIETEPFLCLHSVNAFEQGNEIMLDLVCHEHHNPYAFFYLDKSPTMPNAFLRRFRINLTAKKTESTLISSDALEFPRFDYRLNGQNYQYLYTVTKTNHKDSCFNAIAKYDVQTGTSKYWQQLHYFPGEPVFMKQPHAKKEDDGILFSIAYNSHTKTSSLMILDAQDCSQRAEVSLPFHLPMGLHGNFYHNL